MLALSVLALRSPAKMKTCPLKASRLRGRSEMVNDRPRSTSRYRVDGSLESQSDRS